jgi:phosphopantetheine--protein transferase-like protein
MQFGIDIVEAERFEKMNTANLERMFTEREFEYIQHKNFAPETIAGMFAAKEAFFKALGTGISPNNILFLEVLHGSYGEPYLKIAPQLVVEHKNLSTAALYVSISNTKSVAVAAVFILGSETFIKTYSSRKL